MEGRIQNRTLLQKVADILNIEGTKRFPAVLDLNDVKAVYDISQAQVTASPGGGEGEYVYMPGETVSLFSLGSKEYELIWPSVQSPDNSFALESGFAYRVESLHAELFMTTAGAAAMAGVQLCLRLKIQAYGSDGAHIYYPVFLNPWVTIAAGRNDYSWALHGWANSAAIPASSHTWPGRFSPTLLDGTDPTTLCLELVIIGTGGPFPVDCTFKAKMIARRSTNGIVPIE